MAPKRIAVLVETDRTLTITGGSGGVSGRMAFDGMYGISGDIVQFELVAATRILIDRHLPTGTEPIDGTPSDIRQTGDGEIHLDPQPHSGDQYGVRLVQHLSGRLLPPKCRSRGMRWRIDGCD